MRYDRVLAVLDFALVAACGAFAGWFLWQGHYLGAALYVIFGGSIVLAWSFRRGDDRNNPEDDL